MIWWSQAHSGLGGAVCSVLRSLFAHAAPVPACTFISAWQRRKGESDIWLESPKKTPAIHHSGERVALSCNNTAPCDQSIHQWINEDDNGQSSLRQAATLFWPTWSRETDGLQKPVRRQQAEKSFRRSGLWWGSFGCIPAIQQWVIPQQCAHTLPVSLNNKKIKAALQKNPPKLHNNTEREYHAQYTAKVPTLHRLCGSLLLLADCQSKMPLPSCSYRRLAAPNEMFLVIMSLLIWKWRQQLSEVKHFPWIQEVIYPSLSCFRQPLGGCQKQFIQCFQ